MEQLTETVGIWGSHPLDPVTKSELDANGHLNQESGAPLQSQTSLRDSPVGMIPGTLIFSGCCASSRSQGSCGGTGWIPAQTHGKLVLPLFPLQPEASRAAQE